ncbi:hypothetical protein [Amycolatopsis solani]|uniref:hypothetical protein n=1 Tax=Amycolatopsis solani TaxID=3028615 RepID=UPI0025AF2B14|nr:hypothetical protein [Amycolatopsis sp. MEP2-6]
MVVWWGLAGLLGLLGLCGLLRGHYRGQPAREDPLARYPAAREPARPNADAAHTPLMTPAITPRMLARPPLARPPQRAPVTTPPVTTRPAAVPPASSEEGSIQGRIPAPAEVTAEPVPVAETTPPSADRRDDETAVHEDPPAESGPGDAPRRRRFEPHPALRTLVTKAKRVLRRR